jgi:hypothetical protein
MPQLMNKDPSIRLVRVAELWSYMYSTRSTITNDLNLDLWFCVTLGGRRFDAYDSLQFKEQVQYSTTEKRQYGDT